MRRWILPGILIGLLLLAAFVGPLIPRLFAGGTATFPAPVDGQRVYDLAEALTPPIEEVLERQIAAIEAESGAQVVIYTRIEPAASDESNLADAARLIDEWGIGRAGFDDGFVILLSFDDESFEHGVLSTYAGSGFKAVYLSEAAQAALRDEVIVPAIGQGAVEGGLVAAVQFVDDAISPDATGRLNTYRVINAMVGIPGSILALLVTLGLSYTAWRRYGDDPELADSESVLMAGPPAAMTPPLATVIRSGRASQHSINTTLVELAGRGFITFRNLDQVGKRKSDDDPDPLVDPAIDVSHPPPDARGLAKPQAVAWETIRQGAAGQTLSRESLWRLNDELGPVKERLEQEAVRLGWLTHLPTPLITRWVVIGVGEVVLGGIAIFGGYAIPMSGLTLLGVALGIGGIVTAALGSAMSQRTPQGAYVDAMLKAYRRTLKKTLELARNMNEVVADPGVRVLADTPDKAVVWGIALGLHREVAAVLERGLADARTTATATAAYYPLWLGSDGRSGMAAGGFGGAGGGLFSGSGTPDIGGMLGSLGSLGSSPPSSSSSSGGFGGGSSGGGGGGSSSF
jgi:uncharacterized membrane protein YgcG